MAIRWEIKISPENDRGMGSDIQQAAFEDEEANHFLRYTIHRSLSPSPARFVTVCEFLEWEKTFAAHKERHFLYLKADARRIENLTTNKQEPHTRSSQNKTYKYRSVPPFSIAGPFPFKHRNVAFFCRHTSVPSSSVGGGLCWSRRQNNNSEIGDDASMPGGMICIAVLRRRTAQKGKQAVEDG